MQPGCKFEGAASAKRDRILRDRQDRLMFYRVGCCFKPCVQLVIKVVRDLLMRERGAFLDVGILHIRLERM